MQHNTLGTKLAQRSAADKTIDYIINQLWQRAAQPSFGQKTARRSATKMWSKKTPHGFLKIWIHYNVASPTTSTIYY